MKITINKSAKRVLSLVLALAVLVGSLFVANVGVTLDAKAETEGKVLTWLGDTADSFFDTLHQGSSEKDAIIISTPAELAYLAKGADGYTDGKYYKIADGIKAFNMNGMYGIDENSTKDEVLTASSTPNKKWNSIFNNSTVNDEENNKIRAFAGIFDGNGITIYNLYGSSWAMGIFPFVTGTSSSVTTIQNVTIKSSYLQANAGDYTMGAGGIIGNVSNEAGASVKVDNCSVKNCYIKAGKKTNPSQFGAGAIVGTSSWRNVSINNCLVVNNEISVDESARVTGGLVGMTCGNYVSVANTICIGTTPWSVGEEYSGDPAYNGCHPNLTNASTFTNVYTDQDVDTAIYGESSIKELTTTQMTGAEATKNMALDFSGVWFANTAGVPVLRSFHNFAAKDNEDGTHSEICVDEGCGLIGITANHLYNIVDYTNDTSTCSCGAFVFGTNDVWDGTKASGFAGGSGTEEDPWIIETVEQLFLMVRSTGLNADGTPVYYKVADSVNELYINDTRGYKDQAAFEAAASSLNNWSVGLTSEKEYCAAICAANGTTCSATRHLDACIDFFAGKFDGNGVTIYGLYSYAAQYSYYAPGVGFVPALTDDAVIKNVIFDTNYVKTASNYGGYAGVVTSCFGSYYDGQYNGGKCDNVMAYARVAADDCRSSVINVAVRNAYVETKDCPLTSGTQSYAAGFVSSCFYPKAFSMSNCLFDGTNSTFKLDGNVSLTNEAAILATRTSTQYACVTGSLNVLGPNAPQQVMTHPTHSTDYICEFNSYSLDAEQITVENAPLLNWTAFDSDEATLKKYGTPMPNLAALWISDGYVFNTDIHLSTYKQMALTSENQYNDYDWGALRNDNGVFKNYDSLIGGGTEADPYIISDAITLYRIIASGGTYFGVPQYFKLDRNIDLYGMQWVDTELMYNEEYGVTFYDYQPFAGTIDGDGHTIYNLYSADDDSAGFIPVLDGGTVKNLHFRNASVTTTTTEDCIGAGVIAGAVFDTNTDDNNIPQIINCSVENATVYCNLGYFDDRYFVGYDDVGDPTKFIIENCYFIGTNGDVYIGENSSFATVEDIKTQILNGNTEYTSMWYLGGNVDAIPRLIENAKAQPCADIDGDGIGEEYTTSDTTALKSNLLWKDGYDYIYGDVTGNGTTDMRDLAALQRYMIGEDTIELDGFWTNVKAGKFSIWYDEDDNYDFARKLELYLESKAGIDVTKSKGSSDANFTISIKTEGDATAYSANYEIATAKLTITGGSFTAVEEAVDRIIAETTSVGVPQKFEGNITDKRMPVEVKIHQTSNDNGSLTNSSTQVSKGTYYYVWGDEFDTDGNISYDRWFVRDKGAEGDDFKNLKLANNSDLLKLNTVSGGKLTMNRGIGSLKPAVGPSGSKDKDGNVLEFDSDDMSSSGVLTSADSMLFKRGYMELKAILPNDSNAFPAWWLLTNPSGRGNDVISNSLYSKVFEINNDFDGSRNYSADNYKTYQYKLPTNYFEIDLFEIINNPNSGSKRNAIWYNLHKWYSNCFTATTKDYKDFKVYDLAWDKLEAGTISDFDDQEPLLVMTYNSSTEKYTASDAKINYHVKNSQAGQINAAINQFGGTKYGGFDGEEPDWWESIFGAVQEKYDVNMGTKIDSSDVVTEYIYGFLWTEEEMSYIIKDANGNLLVSVTVDCDDLGYDNGPVLPEQYAHFLIDNHFYTENGASISYNGQMIIDYIRLYQLDNHRDIVTPETEAFNSNNRFN